MTARIAAVARIAGLPALSFVPTHRAAGVPSRPPYGEGGGFPASRGRGAERRVRLLGHAGQVLPPRRREFIGAIDGCVQF